MKRVIVCKPNEKAYLENIDDIFDIMEILNDNSFQVFDENLPTLDLIVIEKGVDKGLKANRINDSLNVGFIAGIFVIVKSNEFGQLIDLDEADISEAMNHYLYPQSIYCVEN